MEAYAPVTAFGALTLSSGVVPRVPEGFVKVADVVVLPAEVPAAGDERDAHFYDSKVLWIGAGAVLVLGVGVIAARRKRQLS